MTNDVLASLQAPRDREGVNAVVFREDVRRGPLAVRRLAELVDLELQRPIVSFCCWTTHSKTHPDGIGARLPSRYVARRAGLHVFHKHDVARRRRRIRTM